MHRHTNQWTALTPPPTPSCWGAGPWIGDMWLGEMRHDAGLPLWQIWLLVCLPENYQPGTAHKNKGGVLFSTLLVSGLALLSVPLSCWPQFFLLLAFLVLSGQPLITEFVLLPTPSSVTVVHSHCFHHLLSTYATGLQALINMSNFGTPHTFCSEQLSNASSLWRISTGRSEFCFVTFPSAKVRCCLYLFCSQITWPCNWKPYTARTHLGVKDVSQGEHTDWMPNTISETYNFSFINFQLVLSIKIYSSILHR